MRLDFFGNFEDVCAGFLDLMASYSSRSVRRDAMVFGYGDGDPRQGAEVVVSGTDMFLADRASVTGISFTTTAQAATPFMLSFAEGQDTQAITDAVMATRSHDLGTTVDRDTSLYGPALAGQPVEAVGSDGADRIRANALFDLAGDDTLLGKGGRDVLHAGAGDDLIEGGSGYDKLVGAGGRDTLLGGTGNDRLSGGNDRDRLDGGEGDDRLLAGRGNDRLSGGDGEDVLNGGGGRDRVDGGAGDDVLAGGGGADLFVLRAGGGDDRLRDFADGVDRIAVAEEDFNRVETAIDGADLIVTLGDASLRLIGGADLTLDGGDFALV